MRHWHSTSQTLEPHTASFWTTGASSHPRPSSNLPATPHHAVLPTPYHPQGNAITERLHRTLKTMLATLYQGHPLRWPRLLQTCQATMNAVVHTSTTQQPYFAFFLRPAPRAVGMRLPTVTSEEDDISIACHVIKNSGENDQKIP